MLNTLKKISIFAVITSMMASTFPVGVALADESDMTPPVISLYAPFGEVIEDSIEVPVNALQWQQSGNTGSLYVGNGILYLQQDCVDDVDYGYRPVTISGGSDGYTDGTVDITQVGTYTITFTCTDTNENVTVRDLVVNIVPSDISIVGYGGNYGGKNVWQDSQSNVYLYHNELIRITPNGEREEWIAYANYCGGWWAASFLIDKNDNIYLICSNDRTIFKFFPNGTQDLSWESDYSALGNFYSNGIIIGNDNHLYGYFSDEGGNNIAKTDENGNWEVLFFDTDILSQTDTSGMELSHIDTDGNLYFIGWDVDGDMSVIKTDQNGTISWEASDFYNEPEDDGYNYNNWQTFSDNHGNTYIVALQETEGYTGIIDITKVDSDGNVTRYNTYFENISGHTRFTLDPENGDIYLLDSDTLLYRITPDGNITPIADFFGHGYPIEIFIGVDGNFYAWGEWTEAIFAIWKLTLPTQAEEPPVIPVVPTPSTPSVGPGGGTASPSAPAAGSSAGTGSSSNTGSIAPIIPLLSSAPLTPEFPSPIDVHPCIDEIKNLDTPELLAYYDEIGVMDRENKERRMTRAEFLKLILHSLKVSLDQSALGGKTSETNRETTSGEKEATESSRISQYPNSSEIQKYADLDQKSWYIPYFNYALVNNMMRGQLSSNETRVMRPNDIISREEVAKILTKNISGSEDHLPTKGNINTFADINRDDTLAPYVQYTYNNCILHGRETRDGEPIGGNSTPRVFEPHDGITLAETVKVLYNLAKVME